MALSLECTFTSAHGQIVAEKGDENMFEKIPWREDLKTDSFMFRISKNFKEFNLNVIIEHKVLESGETVTYVMTGKEDYIPEKFRDFHCHSLTWNRGVKVNIHELAKGFIADYFRDYYVLNGNEWIPTSSWKQDIEWTYSF